MEGFKRPLGWYLRNLRREKKLTLGNASKVLQIPLVYLTELEAGSKVPSFGTIVKISEYYAVSPHKLLGLKNLQGKVQEEDFLLESSKEEVLGWVNSLTNEQLLRLEAELERIKEEIT